MNLIPENPRVSHAIVAILLATCFAVIYINGLHVFNSSDGGFLWYGAWRTYLGEVPTLDFKSYDPGRYYWVAAFFEVFGNYNLTSLKLSIYTFFLSGMAALLFFLVGTVERVKLGLLALLLTVWSFPEHKLFDISISIISVVVVAQCLYRVNSNKWLIAGIWIGVAAFFGRNHVLYMSLATLAALGILWFSEVRENVFDVLSKLVLGVTLGLLPFAILAVNHDGFIENYWNKKIVGVIARESITLKLQYPQFVKLFSVFENPSMTSLTQSIFTLTAYVYPMVLVYMLMSKLRHYFGKARVGKLDATILASAIVGLIYFHHFFSRADFPHLAQSIYPFLILSVLCTTPRIIGLLLVVSGVLLSGYQGLPVYLKNSERYVSFLVTGEERLLDRHNTPLFDLIDYVQAHAKEEDVLYAVPDIPAFYVLAGKRSPSYNSYDIFPMSEDFQIDLVRSLEQARLCWIIFYDRAYDGQEKNRFSRTNPIIYNELIKDAKGLTKFGWLEVFEPRTCKKG